MQLRLIKRPTDGTLTLKGALTRQTAVHAGHPGKTAPEATAQAAAQAAGGRGRDDCQRGRDADCSKDVFGIHHRSPLTAAHRAAFTYEYEPTCLFLPSMC
jgi:hypothetical protein